MNSALRGLVGSARCAGRTPQRGVRILVISLAACLIGIAPAAVAVDVLEETIEQKYVLEPNPTLSIRNTDGSIRVYAGNGPEIFIRAVKKAYTSERLKGIIVDVKATRTNIAIETIFPPRKNALSDRSGKVEYLVIVPQTTRITNLDLVNGEMLVDGLRGGSATAHLVNGWLGGHNCFGDLNLSTVNGRLDIAYSWWEEHKFTAKASSVNGALRAILPSHGAVAIRARTETGQIANAFAPNQNRSSGPVRVLDTATGPGPNSAIELKTTNGNIKIEKSY